MNLDGLHPFARRFAEFFLAAFPHWEGHAEIGCDLHGPKSFLVTIPCPSAEAPSLFICATEEEIQIDWDYWHAHSGDLEWATEIPEEREFQLTVDKLQEITSEKMVIAVQMKGDKWKGSWEFAANDDDAWLEFITTPSVDFDRCYALSWTGVKDRRWSAHRESTPDR